MDHKVHQVTREAVNKILYKTLFDYKQLDFMHVHKKLLGLNKIVITVLVTA